jgi:trigger factor
MAADTVKTTVTELPDSRVRVEAEVAPQEVERRLDQAARSLGRDLRLPGFRRGKVPAPVVIQRVGRDAVLDEAVRSSLGSWYADAIDAADIAPVGDPDLQMGDLPDHGQPLTFTIEIGVRPKATLGEYKGLEVGRRGPAADDEAVEREVEALRERLATLDTVERAAEQGDFVVMDYKGSLDGQPFEGGEGRDQLVELGSGRLIPGFEDQLVGASAGDERTVSLTFPDDYGAEHLAGKPAEFAVTVREVKTKRLPELDEDFAADAGFDTVDELREDVGKRLREGEERQIEAEYREAVLDSVAEKATIDIPHELVHARAHELWHQTLHSLSHQGISREAYLQIAGKDDEEEIVKEAEPDAERALRREAVLAAIVEAEELEPSDGDVLDALQGPAAQERTTPEKLRKRLEKSGRIDELKSDLAQRQALDLVVEAATPISVEQAKARELLWTPEQGEPGERAGGRLWTPGD